MLRSLKELSRGILSTQAMRGAKTAPEPGVLARTMIIHTGPTCKESENFKVTDSKVYTNRNGERIMFKGDSQPPGYVFVPSGNVYISRHCRSLTKNSGRSVYPVFRDGSRKRLATQIGLYVPNDVFEQVQSDFETVRSRISEDLWHMLHKEYPKMPPTDKNKVHRIMSSKYSDLAGKAAFRGLSITIYAYLRDRYTPSKFSNIYAMQNREAISKVNQKVKKTLASWRGEV